MLFLKYQNFLKISGDYMKKEERLTLLIKLLILLSLISFAINDEKNRIEILKLLTGYSTTFMIPSTKKEKKNKQISEKELE